MQDKINRRASKSRLVITVLLLSMCLVLPAFGQEGPNEKKQLARRIRETVEEAHAVRLERLRLREQHQAEIAEVERHIERLKDDIEKTNTTLQEERKLVGDLEATIEKDTKIKQVTELVIARAAKIFLPAAERVKKRVDTGITYRRKERQEQIARIIEGIGNPDPQVQADSLNDYLSFLAEELRLANSVNLWNEPVLLDDGKRQKHAYQIRLGLVNHFFISEDGKTIGLAAKEADREWNLNLDDARQQQLRAVLDILQERRPPRVISVPCAISPVQSPSED